jgi:hypothetical protein
MTRFAAWLVSLPVIMLIAESQGVVGRLASPKEFPELPAAIAQDLASRGCRIPQVTDVPERTNVVHGEFQQRGQRDWAVLCLKGSASTILVYWNDSAGNPAELARMDETITPSKEGYYRILQVADEKFIRRHYEAYGSASGFDRLPETLDHAGIDDGIFLKGSAVYYFYRGKWLRLPGSD